MNEVSDSFEGYLPPDVEPWALSGGEVTSGTEAIPELPFAAKIDQAVEEILAENPDGKEVHIGELVRAAMGEKQRGFKLPREQFTLFLEALNSDDRIIKAKNGFYYLPKAIPDEIDDSRPSDATTKELIEPEAIEETDPEIVIVRNSIEGMLRAWRHDAPRQKRKPLTRKRIHFKKGTNMSAQEIVN